MKLLTALAKAAYALRRHNITLEAIGDVDNQKETMKTIQENREALTEIDRLVKFIKESG